MHEKDEYPYKLSLRDLAEMMAGRSLSLLPLSGMPPGSIDEVSIPIGKISAWPAICVYGWPAMLSANGYLVRTSGLVAHGAKRV